MKHYLRTKTVWISLVLTGVDGLFFGLTNPSKVPSVLLIVGFLLILGTTYWILRGVRALVAVYYPRISRFTHGASAITAVVGIVLALQSVGQLTARDFILFPLAVSALYTYLAYLRRQPQA